VLLFCLLVVNVWCVFDVLVGCWDVDCDEFGFVGFLFGA